MTNEVIEHLKRYCDGKENTEKVEISVLQLRRIIKALEQQMCTREDFIQYAKEHYGIDIEFKDSDKPDTFNGLFGVEVYEDAVSREAAIEEIRFGQSFITKIHPTGEIEHLFDKENKALEAAVERIKALPSVNPQQRVGHWEWVQYDSNPNIGNWHCSECNRIVCGAITAANPVYAYKYCPNCGAKMIEPQESEVGE